MFRSFSRVGELVPVVLSILERRLRRRPVLAPLADADMRARLDRLAASAQGRHQAVADLARDVRFRYFDEPVLEALVTREYDETERALDALEADPAAAGRDAAIDRSSLPAPAAGSAAPPLAGTDRPRSSGGAARGLRPPLLPHPRAARPALRRAATRHLLCAADYDWENKHIHLVVGVRPAGPAARAGPGGRRAPRSEPTDRQVVVDLATWRTGPQPAADETAAAGRRAAGRLRLRPRPWRLDVTVTSTGGEEAEHFRTQHLTLPAKADGGLVEDLLYRNLHPMLAKRLDLWRLANFRLERLRVRRGRLPLPRGGPREPEGPPAVRAGRGARPDPGAATPPVRRRTPGWSGWGCRRWPRCGTRSRASRRGSAPRRTGSCSTCVRRGTSRGSPGRSWPSRSRPLAEGAGLEKVVLRVRIPERRRGARRRPPRPGGRRVRRHGAGTACRATSRSGP